MASHSCTLVEGWFEKYTGELVLAGLVDVLRDLAPHVGDDNDVLQCGVTAEFTEHLEIPSGDPSIPNVGDAVDVDDPCERRTCLIPGKGFSMENKKVVRANAH